MRKVFIDFQCLKKTMSMMSAHLPTDIQDVKLEVMAVPADDKLGEEELHLDLKIKRQVPLIGYLILFFGFFALASAGAAFDLQGPRVSASMNGTGDDDTAAAYPDELLGNLIALSASFGTALYLAISQYYAQRLISIYMWSIFFIASFFVLAFMIVAKEPVEFSRHPDYGLFGWMNATPNRLPLELFMAVVINLIR